MVTIRPGKRCRFALRLPNANGFTCVPAGKPIIRHIVMGVAEWRFLNGKYGENTNKVHLLVFPPPYFLFLRLLFPEPVKGKNQSRGFGFTFIVDKGSGLPAGDVFKDDLFRVNAATGVALHAFVDFGVKQMLLVATDADIGEK